MIKVGFCVAYDWHLLNYSIPPIYEKADLICLSIDKNRRSWSGSIFTWDQPGFEALLNRIDPLGKIKVYEDDFSLPGLSPMQNEVRQRNKIADFMGQGGWHIQLDTDEYFLDFAGFCAYLEKLNARSSKINICCPLINLYKQLPNGFLWVKPAKFSQIEYIQVATTNPHYEYGRRNGYFNILTAFPLLHQSWARAEEDIKEKLSNWGHSADFDVAAYFHLWQQANSSNFESYKNFHHIQPEVWPQLGWAKGSSITEMLVQNQEEFSLPITKKDLALANSLFYSRMKKLANLILKAK